MAVVAVLTLIFVVWLAIEFLCAFFIIKDLDSLPDQCGRWPVVSVVIAGRNEERNLREALSSVLALDYPELQVIFVNDRSTDRTEEVAAEISATDPRLRVVTIETLPPGWLGKNHALHTGAAAADGELILFTDADIVFEPSSLRRAVAYMQLRDLDLVTAGAEVTAPTLPLRLFVSTFAFFFMMYSRPWRVAASKSPREHVGIGAFNLVRASLYRKVGGHAPIAMRPDDDMKLAKLLKKAGGREEFVGAKGMIRVEWYATVREAIVGLEKNAFSGVHYSILLLIFSTVTLLTYTEWPWIALIITTGWLRWVNIAIVVVTLAMVATIASLTGGSAWHALAFPFTALLFLYVIWRSAVIAIARGGIDWRGTHYSLKELRANRI